MERLAKITFLNLVDITSSLIEQMEKESGQTLGTFEEIQIMDQLILQLITTLLEAHRKAKQDQLSQIYELSKQLEEAK